MSVFINHIKIKEKNKVLVLFPIADDTCHFVIDLKTRIDSIYGNIIKSTGNRNRK